MSDEGSGDADGKKDAGQAEGGEKRQAPKPGPATHLFGHDSGAKPWDRGQRRAQPSSVPKPASAPYPRDAQYAPRLEQRPEEDIETAGKASGAPAPITSTIFTDVDDEAELTKLHPNYKLLMRLTAVIVGFLLVIAGLVVDGALQNEGVGIPFGVITGIATLIALFIIIRIPMARYNARGYQISRDRLRVVRGIMWHSDTIVPFGRVQHIDVDQGPIERALNIATMTLHTAGSHNASVRLPGLGHELAIEMREEIRAHIKRETM